MRELRISTQPPRELTYTEHPDGSGRGDTHPVSNEDGSLMIPSGWSGWLYLLNSLGELDDNFPPVEVNSYRRSGAVTVTCADPEGGQHDTLTETLDHSTNTLEIPTVHDLTIILTRME
jgi:hypothetical protein